MGNLLQIFIGESSTDDDKSHKATGCYVCGDGSCSRSKESPLHAAHHDDIMINAELDESIESVKILIFFLLFNSF